MEKSLQDLLKLLPDTEITGEAGKTITDITADSRGKFVHLPERRNGGRA